MFLEELIDNIEAMNFQNNTYDIAIIGGGIAGAGIARDAALRQLKVVLFEKNTFGSGTSSKSSKLIHGGLRYLELAWTAFKKGRLIEAWKNFKFVFSALHESTILERIAPKLVQPIQLVVPIYKRRGQNVLSIYIGTLLYGFMAFISGNKRLPTLLPGKNAVLKLIPNLNPKDLMGGVVIWDHWAPDQLLVQEIMKSAKENGAQTLESTNVKTYQFDKENKTYEIAVEHQNKLKVFYSKKLINASGPWVDKVRASAHEKTDNFIAPVAGSHIMIPKFTNYSVVLQADDKRIFFVINMNENARVGTTERIFPDPDKIKPSEEEVEYLLCALERYFPSVSIHSENVLSKDAGIRPLAEPKGTLMPHSISREHEIRIGPTGVIHVLGVKLTDHRRAAVDVVDMVMRDLKLNTKSITAKIPIQKK